MGGLIIGGSNNPSTQIGAGANGVALVSTKTALYSGVSPISQQTVNFDNASDLAFRQFVYDFWFTMTRIGALTGTGTRPT